MDIYLTVSGSVENMAIRSSSSCVKSNAATVTATVATDTEADLDFALLCDKDPDFDWSSSVLAVVVVVVSTSTKASVFSAAIVVGQRKMAGDFLFLAEFSFLFKSSPNP